MLQMRVIRLRNGSTPEEPNVAYYRSHFLCAACPSCLHRGDGPEGPAYERHFYLVIGVVPRGWYAGGLECCQGWTPGRQNPRGHYCCGDGLLGVSGFCLRTEHTQRA